LLRRDRPYARDTVLGAAERAARRRGRRQRRKAIGLYREVLAREPDNLQLHRKLAALLAREGQVEEAWSRYRRAADALTRRGFIPQAIGVCREAVAALPREAAAWRTLAELELARDRKADALRALLDGRRRFRSRAQRPQAMELLWAAVRVDPGQLAASLDLARLLTRSGDRARALELLDLTCAARPDRVRRLRAAQLRIAPGWKTLGRWLRALLAGR
jgi:tetratricopeptide (TPR) repeat protein